MLWKLFSSDERIMEALEQATTSYDLSPRVLLPANNDEPQEKLSKKAKSRLWLEDWNERDEARLSSDNNEDYWDHVMGNY